MDDFKPSPLSPEIRPACVRAENNTMTEAQIVLASASPRRRELLKQIGITSIVHVVDLDEDILPGETPENYVQRLALAKANQACQERALETNASRLPPIAVLGSDTAVVVDGEILGKPVDSTHACEILSKLSGRSHFVYTAVALVTATDALKALSQSEVCFTTLTLQRIQQYVATGEPMDKAGAYAIQGKAAQFVRSIQGSYSGVMGLPLYETTELLLRINIDPLTLI